MGAEHVMAGEDALEASRRMFLENIHTAGWTEGHEEAMRRAAEEATE